LSREKIKKIKKIRKKMKSGEYIEKYIKIKKER